jgi:uncharacterized OB-fold protein
VELDHPRLLAEVAAVRRAGNSGNVQTYGVGYIQLGEQVIVESRLTTSDPDELKIGMEMELVIIPFNKDDDGNEVVTYAFAPVKK